MNKQDLLHREEYVKLLESLIDNKVYNQKGFSFAIDGSWGAGKTFVLQMLKKNLKNSGFLVFHYNCWSNDYYEEPLIAIISTIIDSLKDIDLPENEGRKKDIASNALKFLAKLLFMITKNKFGVDFQKLGINPDELKENAIETIKADKKTLIPHLVDENFSIKQSVKGVQKLLLSLQSEWNGVVFIVDELDRCLPNYAIKVLERLHHICFDSDIDDFRFIQILSINKLELADSISKAFGKDFNIGTQTTNHSLSPQSTLAFADYYFQKFIQLIIPLPVSNISNGSEIILDGFENEFFGFEESDKKIIDDFFSLVMKNFSMRSKIELVNHTKMMHQLTLTRNPDLQKPRIWALAVELVDCLYRYLLKQEKPKLNYGKIENQGVMFWLGEKEGLLFATNNTDYLDLRDLEKWSQTAPDNIFHDYDGDEVSFNSVTPINYIKFFFASEDSPVRPSSHTITQDSVPFVKAFRETLDIVEPLQ